VEAALEIAAVRSIWERSRLLQGGKAHSRWPEFEEGLIVRSQQKIVITTH
jgi:hypothetical protein